MVGVPGRSKACNTCKQRKIACTFERPQCAQCIKSKRACAGYQRERIFVPNHGRGKEIVQSSTQRPLSSADVRRPPASPKKRDALPLFRTEQSTRTSLECCTELCLPLAKDVPVRHAFGQQLLSEFIYCYLPDSWLAAQKELASWIVLVTELPELTRALETSVLAMSAAKVGRLNDDPVLLKASLGSYVQGLRELQRALWDPKLMYRDETLAACMALWMYEVLECPEGSVRGWISHFGGCERLVQLRGAEAHSSLFGHQVFLGYRTTAIYQVVKSRRPTYLADPEWTDSPWRNIPKTPFDEVLDRTAALANLFVEGFDIEGLESTKLLLAALKIVDRCWKIEAELRQLFTDLENGNPGPLYWPELSTAVNPADDAELGKVFPVAFHFPNLMTAYTCMIYWASLILLWAVLSHVYQLLGALKVDNTANSSHDKPPTPQHTTTQFDMNQLLPVDPRIDVLAASRNICQSLEYCMQKEMKGLGPAITVIPLMAVIDILPNFPHCSRELAWAKALCEKFNEKGLRLMKYLDSEESVRESRSQ